MEQLKIVQGAYRTFPMQAVNTGGSSFPAYASGDTLVGVVYQGNDLTPLFNPTVTWWTNNNTQTGYDQGQVLITITNAQAAMLEAAGTYTVLVQWTPAADDTITAPIVRSTLYVEPAPGAAVEAITPYCQLSDMLMYAGWISIVQNTDVDGEGFYNQRLQARQWMDWCILNQYRGSFVGMFEELSVAAFSFGNVGWRRSLGSSEALRRYLRNNDLIMRPDIIRATAYKAISIIGLAQIGLNNQFASFGAYYRDMASRDLAAITAEVHINHDLGYWVEGTPHLLVNEGQGSLFINLNGTNTLRS